MRVRIHILVCMMLAWAVSAQAGSLSDELNAIGVQQPEVRKTAPDFSLLDTDGKKVSLADFRGQMVLLHFWATWCIPCRHEMPLLHELEGKMKGKPFRILCVNVDRGSRETVQSFMDEVTPHFHTLLDPQGQVRNHYAVRGLPMTYLIAPDGKFAGRIIGEREWNSSEWMQLFNNMLTAFSTKSGEHMLEK